MPWLWGSLHPSDTKHSTFTASPGGNRLTAVPQGSSTPNFRSLVHNCFFCLCFRLLHSTGHIDLNVDSELHKLGKAAWTCLDAPSWKEQTGSVHVSPAVEQGDVEMGTAGVIQSPAKHRVRSQGSMWGERSCRPDLEERGSSAGVSVWFNTL